MSKAKDINRFDHVEKKQQVEALEIMIADFKRIAADLDQQIKIEQQVHGISDINHFNYPPFARVAAERRDNLNASVSALAARLEEARRELGEAEDQVKIADAADYAGTQRKLRSGPRRRVQGPFWSAAANRGPLPTS